MTEHELALERLDLKAGDRVRVVRRIDPHAEGWYNVWVPNMFRPGKQIHTVQEPGNSSGVPLEDTFRYPATCLERYPATCLERYQPVLDCTIPE